MAARSKRSRIEGFTHPGVVLAIRVLVLGALGVSAYLAWLKHTGGVAIGCGPDSDCDKVLQSRWSTWLGLPVSVLALVVEGILFLATFWLGQKTPAVRQRKAWAVLVPTALLIVAGVIWFAGLQIFVIQAICAYCMTAHVLGFLAAAVVLIAAPMRRPPDRLWELDQQVFVTQRRAKNFMLFSILGLAVLVLGQVAYQPKTYRVQAIPGASNAIPAVQTSIENPTPPPPPPPLTNAASSSPIETQTVAQAIAASHTNADNKVAPSPAPLASPATAGRRMFPVYNGQFQLELNEVPVIGSPGNPQVVVSLFDYTCHHCRAMHPNLVAAQNAFSNSLVIVSLPMPLDPGCNPTMLQPNPKHTNACEYARLALAVWRADRTRHRQFDDWMFASADPPSLLDARLFASQLVGQGALEKAAQDPWVEQQLKQDVAIYELAYRAGQGSMPQLIMGLKILVGTYSTEDLVKLLTENLGLTRTP